MPANKEPVFVPHFLWDGERLDAPDEDNVDAGVTGLGVYGPVDVVEDGVILESGVRGLA